MAPEYSDTLSILLQWMERRRRDAEQALQKELYQLRRQWIAFARHVAPHDLFHTDFSALPGGTIYGNDYYFNNNRNFISSSFEAPNLTRDLMTILTLRLLHYDA